MPTMCVCAILRENKNKQKIAHKYIHILFACKFVII